MRVSAVSCFDVGVAYGLRDEAFKQGDADGGWPTGSVGLNCPLGDGIVSDLTVDAPNLLKEWTAEAIEQAVRPEMESGWTDTGVRRDEFDEKLTTLIRANQISDCRLTIYALGVAFLHLRLKPGVDEVMLPGLLRSYEFAAYRPRIAQGLQRAAVLRLGRSVREMSSPLTALSVRELPPVVDDRGYEEQVLVEPFKPVLEMVDEEDRGRAAELSRIFETEDPACFDFEYHGRLHSGDASFVLEARTLLTDASPDPPEREILRLFACVQIGTVLHSLAWAFEGLMEDEIDSQLKGYIGDKPGGRTPQELNRLRMLGVAVVDLADPNAVTSIGEDRAFLRHYAAQAGTNEKKAKVLRACDLAYNVQATEAQSRGERRQTFLNAIVLALAAITLLSVSADAYDFIRAEETLVSGRGTRFVLLVQFLLVLLALAGVILYFATRLSHRPDPGEASDPTAHGYADPTSRLG